MSSQDCDQFTRSLAYSKYGLVHLISKHFGNPIFAKPRNLATLSLSGCLCNLCQCQAAPKYPLCGWTCWVDFVPRHAEIYGSDRGSFWALPHRHMGTTCITIYGIYMIYQYTSWIIYIKCILFFMFLTVKLYICCAYISSSSFPSGEFSILGICHWFSELDKAHEGGLSHRTTVREAKNWCNDDLR